MNAHPIRVIGLGGSLATTSRSLAALRAALEGASEAAETRLFDVASLDLPLYNPEITEIPKAAQELSDAAYRADGLIWSSPMYHGTVSGSFKNALDWLQLLSDRNPPFLTNKVVGLISTAGGVQGLQAVNTMEFAVRALRGWAVPLVIPVARAWEVFDGQGRPLDPIVAEQLRALGREVARAALQFKHQGYCDYSRHPEPSH
jgi:FMN reductase